MRLCFLILLLPWELRGAPVLPEKTLHFEIPTPKDSELGRGVMAALSHVFHQHGYQVNFEDLPTQRGLEELRSGRLDGTAGRIAETDVLYGIKNYVRLEVPITYATVSMWCQKDYASIARQRRLKTGYRRGVVLATKAAGLVNKKAVEPVPLNESKAMVLMLMNKRLDCILGFQWTLEDELKGEYDLSSFLRHYVITSAYYPWIAKSLLPLKKKLEADLRAYPFPAEWTRKFRSEVSFCKNPLGTICPDGIVFSGS